jgi:hypothetical protein
MIDPEQLRGCTLMGVADVDTDVDNTKAHGDVAACVAAHDEREINRVASL